MQAARTVLVEQGRVFQGRNVPAEAGAHAVHEIFPHLAGRICDARLVLGAGVEQQARGLAGAARDDSRPGPKKKELRSASFRREFWRVDSSTAKLE